MGMRISPYLWAVLGVWLTGTQLAAQQIDTIQIPADALASA